MNAHASMQALSDDTLTGLSGLLAEQMGLDFPKERWRDLERGLLAAAQEFGNTGLKDFAQRILDGPLTPREVEMLASHLTVGETYFFRDRSSFDALEQHVLPALIESRRQSGRVLRIWSAGCCTGEEPYSIAILLDRLLPADEHWHVTLLATDINPKFLRKARAGIYGEWSFRGNAPWIRERYFSKKGNGRFELNPRIRKMVSFSHLNLVDDVYPSLSNNTNAMDLIFCRNVLMYFTEERMHNVIGRLRLALVDDGCLSLSAPEASNRLLTNFAATHFGAATYYRKAEGCAPQAALSLLQHQTPLDPVPAVPDIKQDEVPLQDTFPLDPTQPTAPRSVAGKVEAPVPEAVPLPEASKNAEQLIAEAEACANQGRLTEAAGLCEQAIDGDRLNPRSYYLLASISQELGQEDAAEAALRRALYLDPDFVLASFAFGNLRMSQGRYRDSERYFRNALSVLQHCEPVEVVSGADGLQAGRLSEVITSVLASLPGGGEQAGRKTDRRHAMRGGYA